MRPTSLKTNPTSLCGFWRLQLARNSSHPQPAVVIVQLLFRCQRVGCQFSGAVCIQAVVGMQQPSVDSNGHGGRPPLSGERTSAQNLKTEIACDKVSMGRQHNRRHEHQQQQPHLTHNCFATTRSPQTPLQQPLQQQRRQTTTNLTT